ncbi:MAG: SET domain-containing protein [Leptospiraceae bacterium]|nr:SET domain-containing protein [Leptospiraceae bacterium]MDW7976306.1 SET domain-containing protein [Leptospiraceae bacterium]
MIHPDTEIRYVNPIIGYGVFATKKIPMGTIVYVKDEFEIMISQEDFQKIKEPLRSIIDRYSYIDPEGYRIISWDIAKYTNHCCDPNTISTGYGFEIAIKDIEPGEQITDEYGIFNLERTMELYCDKPYCRNQLTPDDFDLYYEEWDRKIIPALLRIPYVPQPLYDIIDEVTKMELEEFLRDHSKYKTVYHLKFKKPVKV